ncbi:hypothetical protein ACQP1V_36245 [Microtetraspora malaysiensis]|uniref:phage tail tube protein n=1 Tax=Microtetraspora malaysiensis TaxID=161358 RepID=UPI003D949DDC
MTVVYWCPSVANKNSPTRAELNAGTDLSREIADVSGWQTTSNQVDTPDMATRFTGKIPGRISADDSSLTFYASQDSIDVRSLLPRDTAGFVIWMDGGDIANRKMDVYPVRVSSVGKARSVGDEPARITVQFAVTSQPAEDVTIPA